jgi:hypothetical protein
VGKGDEYMPLSRAAYFKKSNKKEKKSKWMGAENISDKKIRDWKKLY